MFAILKLLEKVLFHGFYISYLNDSFPNIRCSYWTSERSRDILYIIGVNFSCGSVIQLWYSRLWFYVAKKYDRKYNKLLSIMSVLLLQILNFNNPWTQYVLSFYIRRNEWRINEYSGKTISHNGKKIL